MEITLHTNL